MSKIAENKMLVSSRRRRLTRDSLPHLVYCVINLMRTFIDTRLTRMRARWWGVDIGSGLRCLGVMAMYRLPGTRIVVGRDCEFRSARTSNWVGLTRPCILATVGDNASIEIGANCGISGASITAARSVRIGDRVMVGANAVITDTDWHPLDAAARARGAPGECAPVCIEHDVWLGMNVTVLKGVTIGARTVIAANSIVTRSLPADVVAAGAPAQVVRRNSPTPEIPS